MDVLKYVFWVLTSAMKATNRLKRTLSLNFMVAKELYEGSSGRAGYEENAAKAIGRHVL